MPRGPGPNKSNANATFQNFESGGILKRDRLVTGLVHINAQHRPNLWQDNYASFSVSFVDAATNKYSDGTTGKYIIIYVTDEDYYKFWFKDQATVTEPTYANPTGGVETSLMVDIQAYYQQTGGASDIAAEFDDVADGNANFDLKWQRWIGERDKYATHPDGSGIGGYDPQIDHIVYFRWRIAPITLYTHTHNISGVELLQTGSSATYDHKSGISTETDFKQAMFNNTSKDDGAGNLVTSRRSPYDSSEAPPWRGEMYDDGRFNTGTNDDSHPLGGRFKKRHFRNASFHEYGASLGDSATYLYYVSAATKISDEPRAWGTRIVNGDVTEWLSHQNKWMGDFNHSSDIAQWDPSPTPQVVNVFVEAGHEDQMYEHPEDTGSMIIRYSKAVGDDSSYGYGEISVVGDTITGLTPGAKGRVTWNITPNSVESTTPGSGLIGLEVRTSATYASGNLVCAASGGGIAGNGIASSGFKNFTIPAGITQLYCHFLFIPLAGAGGPGSVEWVDGTAQVHMVKMHSTEDIQYEDELNIKFGKELGTPWYNQEPDDGFTFMWIRSHCISHMNNQEPYNDNYIIKSHRVGFVASSDNTEEAGLVNFGYDGAFQGSYYARGADMVDNYNIKQWKNFKQGDMIRISGALDDANNGVFQIRWDWDWNTEYMYGYTDGDNPIDGGPWPNMQFRLCPYKIKENGEQTNPHTLVTTEFFGQLFQEDITISSPGQYSTDFKNTKIPLVFSSTPANDIIGFALMEDENDPGVEDIEITNPGSGFTLAQANNLVISLQVSDGTPINITALADADNGFTEVTCDEDHNLIQNQPVIINTSNNYYDGTFTVENIHLTDPMKFYIDINYTSSSTGTVTPAGSGTGASTAIFTHTAPANLNISPNITIENLTRRYQDSNNSKPYDYTINATKVDDPPISGTDVHGVPYQGRPGNQGRVSPLNHNFDAYPSDWDGYHKYGSRKMHFAELHEYEGRFASHHAMETWHSPVAGTPEIYGYRKFTKPDGKDVFSKYKRDKFGDLDTNSDYLSMFSNGNFGTSVGEGFRLYYDKFYGKVYCLDDCEFGAPRLLVQVPIKGYKMELEEGGGTSKTSTDVLYDTILEVMWQPFGETNQIKMSKGENLNDDSLQ